MAFRFSVRPHKQFLWLLISRDSQLSNGKEVGLDAGCANMRNKRFFNTSKYIGLDPDNALLKEGKKNNPDAIAINCKILDAPSDLKADFVHCIQVLVNADFDNKEAVAVTQKLISMVNSGGVLLMNTGKQTVQYDSQIEQLLKDNFEKVIIVKYGNFILGKEMPIVFSLMSAIAMKLFPILRISKEHSKTYFRCVGKISN